MHTKALEHRRFNESQIRKCRNWNTSERLGCVVIIKLYIFFYTINPQSDEVSSQNKIIFSISRGQQFTHTSIGGGVVGKIRASFPYERRFSVVEEGFFSVSVGQRSISIYIRLCVRIVKVNKLTSSKARKFFCVDFCSLFKSLRLVTRSIS